jgi:hypothetical protein
LSVTGYREASAKLKRDMPGDNSSFNYFPVWLLAPAIY